MLSAIRSRITYVNVVATLVLVFAMTGGAYAAKRYLITSTGQISPSVLKSLKGANGKAGPAGAAGIAGAVGAQGPAGAPGTRGGTGSEGKEGKPGTAGPAGAKGSKGSPWTAGGTLPSNATETGVWAYGKMPKGTIEEEFLVPISFSIPLPEALGVSQVHYINLAGEEVFGVNNKRTSTVCTGTAATPAAEPGNLCVYAGGPANLEPHISGIDILTVVGELEVGASTSGAVVNVVTPAENATVAGTWAVTAE